MARLTVDEKPVRTIEFTTWGSDWESGFWRCLGQPCNGWKREIDLRAYGETTPWWWRLLQWLSFGLLPDIHQWEVEYRAVYSRWENCSSGG